MRTANCEDAETFVSIHVRSVVPARARPRTPRSLKRSATASLRSTVDSVRVKSAWTADLGAVAVVGRSVLLPRLSPAPGVASPSPSASSRLSTELSACPHGLFVRTDGDGVVVDSLWWPRAPRLRDLLGYWTILILNS